MSERLALEGIKILDLSAGYPGAFGTWLLGDLGAEVINIEAPPGPKRRPFGLEKKEAAYQLINRNKKSITLNLKSEKGRQIFYQLAEKADVIASRAGITAADAKLLLKQMTRRGLVWPRKGSGELLYRLAPFVVGAYEAQLGQMDHEFAHLTEEYLADGGAAGIMKPQPALHRVMPTSGSVKSEWVLPYDDVRTVLESAKAFAVRDCICRAQQDQLGRKCDFELKNCLSFSGTERAQRPGDISRDEALAILDRTEEAGLVHTVSNVMEGSATSATAVAAAVGFSGESPSGASRTLLLPPITMQQSIPTNAPPAATASNGVRSEPSLSMVTHPSSTAIAVSAVGCA